MTHLTAWLTQRVSPQNTNRFSILITLAAIIGLIGGLIATAFSKILNFTITAVWQHLLPYLTSTFNGSSWIATILITTAGGILVGICLKKFGVPGEIAAVVDNIHMKGGRLDHRQSPSMAITALTSITAGCSAGPEAPLVQIIGSLASRIADFLKLNQNEVRTLTFCGMAAALGAFFGAPLGGALFALEIPHRNGLEYFEALIPAVISAFISFFVFASLTGFQNPLYPLPGIANDTLLPNIVIAIGLGILGALVGILFQWIFKNVGKLFHPISSRFIIAGALGGLAIGTIAAISPLKSEASVLFWGEMQLHHMLNAYQSGINLNPSTLALALCAVALCKILAISFTLHSGFRGGFIFPLFFVGASLGLALHSVSATWLALPVAVFCLMAAVNVSITKTPLSTAVLLTTLSATSMLPVILAASLTSFLVSARVRVIITQRSRPTTMELEEAL